jgi:hypothetical protein
MAKAPDHMAGINALPKWNPANPTSYAYDPANYDPADYADFKAARLAKQGSGKTARKKATTANVSKFLKDRYHAKQQGNALPNRDDIDKAAKAGHTLRADLPSTCFESVTWKDGIVTGTFYRGGAIVYDGEMDLDEFIDFASSDSLGEWYNANKPF